MCELSPLAFHGDTIFCIDYQGQPFTPMKPIVENLGLGWASQSQKLNDNKDRWTVTIIVTVAQDGNEREMLCLPVRKLPAYLASINPNKVREELRPKIELYQAESDDALWNYWMNGKAERATTQADDPITPDQQCTLRAMVKAKFDPTGMSKGQIMQVYGQIWSRFSNYFRIAKYSQLPQSRMSEAVEYLTKLELKQSRVEQPKHQASLPQGFPPLAERGADAMANLLKLRADLFTNSLAIQRVMETALHHNNEEQLTDTQKEFSRTMGKSVGAFFMAINHDLIAIEELFKSFMEAEKMIYG